jgi:hypothetical protein
MKSAKGLMSWLRIWAAAVLLGSLICPEAGAESGSVSTATPRYQTVEVLEAIPPALLAGGPRETAQARPVSQADLRPWAPTAASSPGTIMGYTYYDYQHNGSTGRQVGEFGGTVQTVWMDQDNPQLAPDRTIQWNKVAVAGSPTNVALDNGGNVELLPLATPFALPDGKEVKPSIQSGYVTLDLLPNGNAVPFFHLSSDWVAVVDSVQQGTFWGGSGLFELVAQPGAVPALWPKGVVDMVGTDTVLHAVVHDADDANVHDPFYYFRGTLTTTGPWPVTSWSLATYMDLENSISHVVAQDPSGNKVAIVYARAINTGLVGWAGQTSNNVAYFESTNAGISWTGPTMVTSSNLASTGDLTYADVNAVYDENGILHIVYATLRYLEVAPAVYEYRHDRVTLWHWNSQRQTSRMVQSAYWHNTCAYQDPVAVDPAISLGVGAWNLLLAKPGISVKPAGDGPGTGIADQVLYASWVQFGPTQTDCSSLGWTNSEIYVAASSDGGNTWDAPRNVTGTNTAGCFTGGCGSEHWVTAAAQADSGVYLSYVEDTDAGGISQNEGDWSESPYKVLALAAWPPVAEARMVVLPVNPAKWQGPFWQNRVIDVGQYPAPNPVDLKVQVSNPGTAALNFTAEVSDINSGNLYMTVEGVTSYNGSIAAAGAPETLTIHVDPTGLEFTSTFFLNLTSNAAAKAASAQASVMALEFRVPPGNPACPIVVTGDLDGNGLLQSADVIRMVNYVFKSGATPTPCAGVADANCDNAVQSADIIRMVNHVFKGGVAPCDACSTFPGPICP